MSRAQEKNGENQLSWYNEQHSERSHSGLVRRLGKAVYRKVSRVQIPPSPPIKDKYMKNQKKLKPYANFLFEVGVLAKTPRSGFRHLHGWNQSISEHLLRTTYIGFTLAYLEQEKGEKVDIEKVIKCCLFHDLGEARASDLDYISQKYTKSDELAAVNDAVKNLSFGNKILSIFKEAEERSTKESIITKDADKIELLCSLKEIIDSGNPQAKLWIPPLLKRLKTSSAKELADEILNTDSNDWWFENKEDEYWINGGKKRK